MHPVHPPKSAPADVSSLSEYHFRKHCQGQKHNSLLSLSQLRPISSYFAPQATAGSTSAAVCYNIPGPASASCSSEALLVYSSDCDDDDCAREPGDCYYDGASRPTFHHHHGAPGILQLGTCSSPTNLTSSKHQCLLACN